MSLAVNDALKRRRSVRKFLDKPVKTEKIRDILELAAWSASGVNMQPWFVDVLTGQTLAKFTDELYKTALSDEPIVPDYNFYPETWREPYQSRRRDLGAALYESLNITRDQQQKMDEWQARNFRFFGAPVGLIITMDRDMGKGSWLDLGIFLQSIMLAAESEGLNSCPQASFAYYPDKIRQLLNLQPQRRIICGVALGFGDNKAAENNFPRNRLALGEFCKIWL